MKDEMTVTIDVVDLAGDGQTRGRIFGVSRAAQIQAYLSDWLESLRETGIAEPLTYITGMLQETDFLAAIRSYTPELLEEVAGIALGADQPLELILAAQFMDEEWAYRRKPQRRAEALQKCSSVAIRSHKGVTWIGQNMDLGAYTDGHQLLLRTVPHGPELGKLIFTVGGMIGLLGANTCGVGICVNSLPQLPSASKGVPVAFVIRKLLQAKSAAEAAQWVQAMPHATGQHYLIADPDGIRSFEASSAGVVEYHPPDPSRVLHTNHPLAGIREDAGSSMNLTNTVARLRSLTDRLATGDAGVEAIKAALSSADDPENPVCRLRLKNGQVNPNTVTTNFTTGSMISTLQKGSNTVDSYVSAGPPSLRGYIQVSLSMTATPASRHLSPGRSIC